MLITLSTTLMLVILCVVLHYEAMRLLRRAGNWLHRNDAWHRWHLSILVSVSRNQKVQGLTGLSRCTY